MNVLNMSITRTSFFNEFSRNAYSSQVILKGLVLNESDSYIVCISCAYVLYVYRKRVFIRLRVGTLGGRHIMAVRSYARWVPIIFRATS